MSDPFMLLGLPRRPWLEETDIRAAFQERARRCHPDRGGDAGQFAVLNAAQAQLSDTATRLQLLAGDSAATGMPDAGEFGFRVGAVLREADALLAKRVAAKNALERALLARDVREMKKTLESSARDLEAHFREAGEKLRELDAMWPDVSSAAVATLGVEFRFLQRWRAQLRERELALSI